MRNFTIGYFADGPWSHRALERLIADPTLALGFICGRYDSPDPVLRGVAESLSIPFFVHLNINTDEFYNLISGLGCDLFVSMSFNQIFRQRITNLPPDRTINCHAGKLPFYRGRNILNWALINDEREFGITVHYVDSSIDTGDIILQETYPITDFDDYSTLLLRAYDGCSDLLYQAVKLIQGGKVTTISQQSIHPVGFYCSARKEGDERIEWHSASREIFNFVRAICRPGPEARTACNGQEIRINKVELIPDAPNYRGIPGAVLQKDEQAFLVKTSDSFVRVLEWSGDCYVRVGDRLK